MSDKLWTPPAGLADVWLPPKVGKKGSATQSDWNKEMFVRLVEHGYNYSQAAERLGLTYKWWATTRKRDADFEAAVLEANATELVKWEYPDLTQMPFHEFVLAQLEEGVRGTDLAGAIKMYKEAQSAATAGAPLPEPAMLSLLCLGGLALVRRRR